ncbi:MAG: hypothetical protein CMJ18_11810 [Phycisphaeraceae bacterium]|nr:hypothetical protein [Phycisphaeraceae bacterium]
MLEPVLKFLDDDASNALERLQTLLRIPSVSTDPQYGDQVAEAAGWVADAMASIGLDARIEQTDGHPIVLGHARPDDVMADGPRVLYYGHYDVQPPDPIDAWTSPPFEPQVRDGALYARGASDDKGQVCTILEALRAWRQVHGKWPVPVSVIIEGEEECGSVNLPKFVAAHRDELNAQFVAISDTGMWDRQTVAITYGLRGVQFFNVELHGPNRDLHSGVYGGAVANPAVVLCRVLGGLFDEHRRVTIPQFYDDVATLTEAQREAWRGLGFDEHRQLLGPAGVDRPIGEAGFSTLERRWARPSCDINGLYGGYMGAGTKTIVPSFAGAKVSFRLAPNQRSEHIGRQFHAWLESHDVEGCRWKIEQLGSADPIIMPTDAPYMAAAQRAVERTSGRSAVLIREGATLPILTDFKSILGLDCLLLGFGLADDRIHAPDEKFDLACFALGCRTHAALLAEL